MRCPNCKEQAVVVLPKASSKEHFYIECPKMECWAVLVQIVKQTRTRAAPTFIAKRVTERKNVKKNVQKKKR
jgi:hypothetical protein